MKILDKGFVKLIDSMGSDHDIAEAARVSYGKTEADPKRDESLIRYLMRNKHTSPMEMVEFKFHIKAPIFVARQWVRHRTASMNEISGRYTELKNECYVPENKNFTRQDPNNKQGGTNEPITLHTCDNPNDWCEATYGLDMYESETKKWNWSQYFTDAQRLIHWHYKNMLGTGVRRELARINLPLSQYTEWYWKIDLHNLLHFLKLRMDSHAQYEIRVYAEAIYEMVKEVCPITCAAFEDYVLQSMTLSKKDLKLLSHLIDLMQSSTLDPGKVDNISKTIFANSRERMEAIDKMIEIFEM